MDQLHLLPEFELPPVVETVLSAQFSPLTEFQSVHFGLFWQSVRDRFPKTEEKLALAPAFERFGDRPKRRTLHFEAREAGGPERVWFVDATGSEMIQLQADRFIKNWRKTGPADKYPRYEKSIRPGFERDFRGFQDFAAAEALGPIKVNQCEVTYVNHIVVGEGWSDLRHAGDVFSFLGGVPEEIEDGRFAIRIPIRVQGDPVGRLTVETVPAFRESDGQAMYVMTLTARGMIGSGTEFFALGRETIVRYFTRLTSSAMHSIWKRTR